ncbi:hypothetical protein ACFXO9_31530 [Nocardia tengchongensis]|uniref:hypothetical protein n=1 Tax=Nocardia tengchongensis TaxID=2055889 RepID=UPI0036910685
MTRHRNRDGLAEGVISHVGLADWAVLLHRVSGEPMCEGTYYTRLVIQSYGVFVEGRTVEDVTAEHDEVPGVVEINVRYVRRTFERAENRRLLMEFLYGDIPEGKKYCRVCGMLLPEQSQFGRPRVYCQNRSCADLAYRESRQQ